MKPTQRMRIERHLREFDDWHASAIPLKTYVQQRGEDLSTWRARLSWEKRWRQMLADTPTEQTQPNLAAFVRAHPSTPTKPASKPTSKTTTKPQQPPTARADFVPIELGNSHGGVQARVQWPTSHLAASSAWLREVLA